MTPRQAHPSIRYEATTLAEIDKAMGATATKSTIRNMVSPFVSFFERTAILL